MRLHNVEEAILRFEPINQDHALSTPTVHGVDYNLMKNLVLDHINSLQSLNLKLGASVEIAEKLGELKAAYETIFGGPVVDNINEGYQDNVSTVANEIIKRSQSTPFTKEELLRAIESEARGANVPEIKFKDSKSKAWPDFVKDVLVAVKGKVKFSRPGVAAAATERKEKQEKLLKGVAQIIDHAVSETFPDGDPIDYIWPRLQRLGVQEYDVHDLLDRACKKVMGFKSFDDYMGSLYDDYFADNPEAAIQSGLTRNPYTNKPIDFSGVIAKSITRDSQSVIDMLSHLDIVKDPKIIATVTANKDAVIKALLQRIKLKPNSLTPRNVIRNLVAAGINWPEFAVIQKSIDPAKIAEDAINPGDVLMLEGNTEAVVGTILSIENDTIIIEGSSYPLTEAEYQGREVQLGKPMRDSAGSKKFKVYVKNPKTGNIKKVTFGDRELSIKRDDPERRRSFRARHKCDQKKDKTTAGYWSCKLWGKKNVSDIV